MLLITTFVELRVVAGRSRTRAGSRGLEKNGMVREWHGRGMAIVNQTRLHCVNQMGRTHSKLLAARHAMCESALNGSFGQTSEYSDCTQLVGLYCASGGGRLIDPNVEQLKVNI
jgi:hypothetical protein